MAVILPLVFALSVGTEPANSPGAIRPRTGSWGAWLDSRGGAIIVGLELAEDNGKWRAWIINGPERIEVPHVAVDAGKVVLDIDHYDARIVLDVSTEGARLDGVWSRPGRDGEISLMGFHAKHGVAVGGPHPDRAPSPGQGEHLAGRWAVEFSLSDEPAVGVFTPKENGTMTGTFLTSTGDYRYLTGIYYDDRMELSRFDGGSALLFKAKFQPDGTLSGNVWSRDGAENRWTARKDPKAAVPSGLVRFDPADQIRLSDAVVHDLDGAERSLKDSLLPGKVALIEVFGSWCPNCHDAAAFMVELHRKYGDRGLAIVGLAFELTGEFERDAKVVRAFGRRHGVSYPLLVAGVTDKDDVKRVLPVLDPLRAYPTTLFVDSAGRVRAIHSGFSGPATGEAYEGLRREFEALVEQLLAE